MINIFKSLWHLRHVICNNHDGSAIAILLLLLCVSLPLNAQKKTYPDTPEDREVRRAGPQIFWNMRFLECEVTGGRTCWREG